MSKGSILVVDDESEIREGLELLLASEGYGVSSAETGASGLAKLEEHPYDLAASRRKSCPIATGSICCAKFACAIRSFRSC